MALLVACSSRAEQFAQEIRALDGELDIRVAPEVGWSEDIDTALVWQPPAGLLGTLPSLKLIVSVGAGVDGLLADPTVPDVPLVRFVDADLTTRMAEYIALNVLTHHRRMTEFRELQMQKAWKYLPEPAAREVRVGLMGTGVLGAAAANALEPFGYQLRGWSRTPKALDGVTCFAGAAALDQFLADTDILAVLLRDARHTRYPESGAVPQTVAQRPQPASAGPRTGQCRARRPAGRRRHRRGAECRRALRCLPRCVRDRAAAGVERTVGAPPGRRHAAQRRRERSGGNCPLHVAADAGAAARRATGACGGPRTGLLMTRATACVADLCNQGMGK